jgi:hypothetical protein
LERSFTTKCLSRNASSGGFTIHYWNSAGCTIFKENIIKLNAEHGGILQKKKKEAEF